MASFASSRGWGQGRARPSCLSPPAQWGGTGSLQAIGGTWNSTSHVFTVSDVQSGTSGTPVALNLGSTQRGMINGERHRLVRRRQLLGCHGAVGYKLYRYGHSRARLLDSLKSQLTSDELNLIAWQFGTTNYAVDQSHPAYLSFDMG